MLENLKPGDKLICRKRDGFDLVNYWLNEGETYAFYGYMGCRCDMCLKRMEVKELKGRMRTLAVPRILFVPVDVEYTETMYDLYEDLLTQEGV